MTRQREKPPRSAGSGGTPATRLLAEAGVQHEVHAFPVDDRPRAGSAGTSRVGTGFGEEAAAALGVDPARVFKTLVADVDGRLSVAVVPVTHQVDLKAIATAVGGKRAVLAEPSVAERVTGYVVGGISPLGQRRHLPTVVDVAALAHETVFVSGGRRGLDIELAPADLIRLIAASVAAIGRR